MSYKWIDLDVLLHELLCSGTLNPEKGGVTARALGSFSLMNCFNMLIRRLRFP